MWDYLHIGKYPDKVNITTHKEKRQLRYPNLIGEKWEVVGNDPYSDGG
jgi:hypothetical protein